MTRRGAGEGSVYKDKGSGLWVAAISLQPSVDGKRQRKYIRAKTKSDVISRMETYKSIHGTGLSNDHQQARVAEYLTWWLDIVLAGTVKRSTATDYRWILASYVIPAIGDIKLIEVGPEDVQIMMRVMEDGGLSPSTIRLARSVLRRAFGTAEKWGYIPKNPAALVDPPAPVPSMVDDLTAEDARAVLKTASTDPLWALA